MQLTYELELPDQRQHPVYVSTALLCTTPPIFLAPAVEEIVAQFGYTQPFCAVAQLSVLAFDLTMLMAEPRHPSFVTTTRL